MASGTIWDHIYQEYLAGGPAWATLKEDLHPGFLSFMAQTAFPIKVALDIGCGTGKYLKYLQIQGFRTAGLDSSATAIAMARQLLDNQGEYLVADMYEYQYPKSTYDLIISHATLHHGKKRQVSALLDNIYQALIPNGRIFISLPSDASQKNWAMLAQAEVIDDGTCLPVVGPEKGLPHSFYVKEEIEQLFSRYSGLEVVLDNDGSERWIITGEKSRE